MTLLSPVHRAHAKPRSPANGAGLEAQRAFIERWLLSSLPPASPESLITAMREAALGGGKRLRPLLVTLVAEAYPAGEDLSREMAGRMAAAVELVHAASLVHDDLPAFDDAATRRGRPSCHAAFGEPTAILVGDALLALAFETLCSVDDRHARVSIRLSRLLADATGARRGIIGGQALEQQSGVDLDLYHARKTASLFRASAAGGAVAAGHEQDAPRWARFGELVGLALQLRDDIDDCAASAESAGKPVRRDAELGRPNAALVSSVAEARGRLALVVREASGLLGEPTPATRRFHDLLGAVSGGT